MQERMKWYIFSIQCWHFKAWG